MNSRSAYPGFQFLSFAGFEDPFDTLETITLDNKEYRFLGLSLMAGKLDWVLLRRLLVKAKAVGNDDYAASDHKWMMVDVVLEETAEA